MDVQHSCKFGAHEISPRRVAHPLIYAFRIPIGDSHVITYFSFTSETANVCTFPTN